MYLNARASIGASDCRLECGPAPFVQNRLLEVSHKDIFQMALICSYLQII